MKNILVNLYDILDKYDHDDVEGLEAIEKEIIENSSEKQAVKSIAWKLRLANKIIEFFNLEKGEMIGESEANRTVNVGNKVLTVIIH